MDLTAEFAQAEAYLRNRLDHGVLTRLTRNGDLAASLLEHLRTRTVPRLLFSPAHLPHIARLAARLDPEEQAWQMETANEALAGRVIAASNPYCRRFVELDPKTFDFSRYDHYDREAIHGLGRQRWLAALAKAYWLDQDERYFRSAIDHWDFYWQRVPEPDERLLAGIHAVGDVGMAPPYGELDTFIRLTNWWWTFWVAVHAPPMTPQRCVVLLVRCLKLFDVVAARGIRMHEHNFTSMQMEALYLWATALPEVVGMDVWRHCSRNCMESSLARAVFEDGVQWEKSAGYHAGCIRWYAASLLLGERNGHAWAEPYRLRLRRMGAFLDAIVTPDGKTPLVSDSDRDESWRGALALLRCIFPDMTFRRPVSPSHYSVWASDGAEWDAAATAAPKPAIESFPDAGIGVAHHTDDATGMYVLVDNGPNNAGHAHKNNLTVHFEALRQPVIVDPGRWIYTRDRDRLWVTRCQSHNTVYIEDQPLSPQDELTFNALQVITSTHDPRITRLTARQSGDLAILGTAFGGYADEPQARVKRTAVMPLTGDACWLAVVDEIESPAEHVWTNSWLFPATAALRQAGAGWRARLDRGAHVAIGCAVPAHVTVRDDGMFWCRQYAEKAPARWVRFSGPCREERRAFIFAVTAEEGPVPSIAFEGDTIVCAAAGKTWRF